MYWEVVTNLFIIVIFFGSSTPRGFFFFTSELWFDGNHGEKILGSSLKVSLKFGHGIYGV